MQTGFIAKHLLILCCYGGTPHIDLNFHVSSKFKFKSTYVMDPTDWIAVDTSGAELNASLNSELLASNPELYIPSSDILENCNLFNLTFTNTADEHLFENHKGKVECRCPYFRSGPSCENNLETIKIDSSRDFLPAILIKFLCFVTLTLLITLALMRCGFCDCFGPFRSPFSKDDLDAPLDQNTINRCLELVRAHEARQSNKVGEYNKPLISTVSEGCSPYNTTVEPLPSRNQYYISHSPPPSYRSEMGSFEQLQNLAINSGNTKL